MDVLALEREPIKPTRDESAKLAKVRKVLTLLGKSSPALIGPDGERLDLPDSLLRVLREAVEALATGGAVQIIPIHSELTTQQAAQLLNVSRQYLVRLLDQGDLPYHKVGTHRRIRLDDVLNYRLMRDTERRARLDRLTQMSQELGLYDVLPPEDS